MITRGRDWLQEHLPVLTERAGTVIVITNEADEYVRRTVLEQPPNRYSHKLISKALASGEVRHTRDGGIMINVNDLSKWMNKKAEREASEVAPEREGAE